MPDISIEVRVDPLDLAEEIHHSLDKDRARLMILDIVMMYDNYEMTKELIEDLERIEFGRSSL